MKYGGMPGGGRAGPKKLPGKRHPDRGEDRVLVQFRRIGYNASEKETLSEEVKTSWTGGKDI